MTIKSEVVFLTSIFCCIIMVQKSASVWLSGPCAAMNSGHPCGRFYNIIMCTDKQ